MPDECAESDIAIKYLAKETDTGHYDSINLFVLATLLIFVSVAFLAVNNGRSDESSIVSLTKENFLSGEYTRGLEASYNEQLPIPEFIKAAEERLSLIYGFGNKITDPIKESILPKEDEPYNPFKPDDSEARNEGAFTTKQDEQTDELGNATDKAGETVAHGSGTAAADHPSDPFSNGDDGDITTDAPAMTTTNNTAPNVRVTTTVPATRRPPRDTTTTTSSDSSTDDSDTSSMDESEGGDTTTAPIDSDIDPEPDTSDTVTDPPVLDPDPDPDPDIDLTE